MVKHQRGKWWSSLKVQESWTVGQTQRVRKKQTFKTRLKTLQCSAKIFLSCHSERNLNVYADKLFQCLKITLRWADVALTLFANMLLHSCVRLLSGNSLGEQQLICVCVIMMFLTKKKNDLNWVNDNNKLLTTSPRNRTEGFPIFAWNGLGWLDRDTVDLTAV